MELLEQRILSDGRLLPGGILKVDNFLNHQMDPALIHEMAKEFRRLFDGEGVEYRARIESIGRDRVELTVLETRQDDREPELALTVIMALPKGDRQKWALEKLTELGVRRFIPRDAARADRALYRVLTTRGSGAGRLPPRCWPEVIRRIGLLHGSI